MGNTGTLFWLIYKGNSSPPKQESKVPLGWLKPRV